MPVVHFLITALAFFFAGLVTGLELSRLRRARPKKSLARITFIVTYNGQVTEMENGMARTMKAGESFHCKFVGHDKFGNVTPIVGLEVGSSDANVLTAVLDADNSGAVYTSSGVVGTAQAQVTATLDTPDPGDDIHGMLDVEVVAGALVSIDIVPDAQ